MSKKKPNTMKARIVLRLEVDLEAWANTYGLSLDEARGDAREHLGALVLDAVENLSHITQENLAQVTEASITASGIRDILKDEEA